mmetsp:Transcript_12693/g.18003  ORF Transcript_12693/g.18003 Transcript_12693/m.18003 type:complete len:212 (-) Transcript_12693:788-1423(-)
MITNALVRRRLLHDSFRVRELHIEVVNDGGSNGHGKPNSVGLSKASMLSHTKWEITRFHHFSFLSHWAFLYARASAHLHFEILVVLKRTNDLAIIPSLWTKFIRLDPNTRIILHDNGRNDNMITLLERHRSFKKTHMIGCFLVDNITLNHDWNWSVHTQCLLKTTGQIGKNAIVCLLTNVLQKTLLLKDMSCQPKGSRGWSQGNHEHAQIV